MSAPTSPVFKPAPVPGGETTVAAKPTPISITPVPTKPSSRSPPAISPTGLTRRHSFHGSGSPPSTEIEVLRPAPANDEPAAADPSARSSEPAIDQQQQQLQYDQQSAGTDDGDDVNNSLALNFGGVHLNTTNTAAFVPYDEYHLPYRPGVPGVLGGFITPRPMAIDGQRRSGNCKFFNSQKGFGFLIDTDPAALNDGEVFVHYSAIQSVRDGPKGFKSLAEGELVEYTLVRGEKGWLAKDVTGPEGAPCIGTAHSAGAGASNQSYQQSFGGHSSHQSNGTHSHSNQGQTGGGMRGRGKTGRGGGTHLDSIGGGGVGRSGGGGGGYARSNSFGYDGSGGSHVRRGYNGGSNAVFNYETGYHSPPGGLGVPLGMPGPGYPMSMLGPQAYYPHLPSPPNFSPPMEHYRALAPASFYPPPHAYFQQAGPGQALPPPPAQEGYYPSAQDLTAGTNNNINAPGAFDGPEGTRYTYNGNAPVQQGYGPPWIPMGGAAYAGGSYEEPRREPSSFAA